MTMSTTVRSMSAIVVGVFFTAVTGWILTEDVLRHGAPVTTKHVMTLAVLAGTVFFGHALWRELRAWRIGTALGCTILFLAGTTTCVLMSAGRNAEVVTNKVLVANSVNSGREAAQKDRDEARLRYQAALKAEEAECSDGNGAKCQAKRITRMVRRDEYDAAEATLRTQKPEAIANSDIRAAAELLSRLPYVTANVSALEALLQLAFPFLQSLFCEVGAIVGFAIGLGHNSKPRPSQTSVQLPETPTVATTVASQSEQPEVTGWVPMSVAQARELAKRAKAEDLFQELRSARNPLCNDELAKRLNINKGECSRRVTALKEAGLLHRQSAGRYVAISLRPLH